MTPRLALIGSALLFLLAGFSGPQGAEAFEIRPAIVDLDLPSGSSTVRELKVRNTDAEPLEVFFTIQKFIPAGGGQPRFLDPTDVGGLPSWVRLSERGLRLAPGEERTVRVQIDVPAGTEAGGSYAGLFTTEKLALESPVGIGRRIATLLLVSVDGAKRPARIQFDKSELKREEEGESYEVGWKNDGSSHGLAGVRLVARRMTLFGPKQSMEDASLRLLPGEARTVRLAWDDGAPVSWVQARAFIDGKLVEGSERSLIRVHPGAIGVFAGIFFFIGVSVWWRKRRHAGKGFLRAG